MPLRARPLTLAEANAAVARFHRHHKPVVGHRFSIGAFDGELLVGAVIVGRPVARNTDQYAVAEVTRLVTNGAKNACSFLYARAARAAEAMGFDEIGTFILESEDGASLRAAGWTRGHSTDGGTWAREKWAAKEVDSRRDEAGPRRGYFPFVHCSASASGSTAEAGSEPSSIPAVVGS
jgi:hypothetical protein